MFDHFSSLLKLKKEDEQKIDTIFAELESHYSKNKDPWGLNLKRCREALCLLLPMYKYYFKVRVFGAKNVKNTPYMVISNHSGQLPIDGVLLTIAFLWDVAPPRILRGMVERFLVKLPFLGDLTAQTGSILGDRKNCQYLIDKGESILAFPEGIRGVSKNTKDFYKLQRFTTGFFRLAVQNELSILPVAIIGAEEMYPLVYHSKRVARFLNLPSLPITPLFPLAGPLGVLPLPSPIDIYIGRPYHTKDKIPKDASDKTISGHIDILEDRIKVMLHRGLIKRRPFLNSLRLPLFHYLRNKNKEESQE